MIKEILVNDVKDISKTKTGVTLLRMKDGESIHLKTELTKLIKDFFKAKSTDGGIMEYEDDDVIKDYQDD